MTAHSVTAAARPRRLTLVFALAASTLAAGCAGMGANPRDPLEPMNRKVMDFNDRIDAVALKPVAETYRRVLPPLVRTGVSNFFGNLGDAWSFVNSALQFRFHNAAENFLRFNVNTFFGLGGILDIASDMNIERHKEDFGQTLGRWGVPAGPYIVLPLLGPSTLRDTMAFPIDRKADLVRNVDPWRDRYFLYTARVVDARSNLLRVGTVLEEAALDRYSFTRDAHLQRRRAEIVEGRDSATAGQEPKADGTPAPASGAPAAGAAPAAPASAPRN